MNSTLKRIQSNKMQSVYLNKIKNVLIGLLKHSETERNKFDSLLMLLTTTKLFLKELWNYNYVPITNSTYQMLEPMQLIEDGLEWIEKEVFQYLQPYLHRQIKEEMKSIEFNLQNIMRNYLQMISHVAFYFSEIDNLEMFEKAMEKYQLFMSLHFFYKRCYTDFNYYNKLYELLVNRYIDMKH